MKENYETISINNKIENNFKVFLGGKFKHKIDNIYTLKPHWHEFIELIFVVEGNLEILTNNVLHYCKQGDLFIINSCEIHATMYRKNLKTRFYCIQFDPSFLNISNKLYHLKYALPFTITSNSNLRHLTKEDLKNSNISSLSEAVYLEYTNKKYAYELAIQTKIMDIFLNIVRIMQIKGYIDDTIQNSSIDSIDTMSKVLDYINDHLKENITLNDVAKISNLSYNYFPNKFKKFTGKSFKEYLQFIRIQEAEKLLLDGKLNITEIAYNLGFSDTSYFIHVFKKQKEITPKQFLKQFKHTSSNHQ